MKKAFLDLDGTLLDSKLRHKRVLEDIFYVCTGISDIDVADFVDYKADGNNTKKYLMDKFLLPEGDADILSKGWTEHIEDLDYLAGDNWYFDSMLFVKCLKESDYCNIIVTARQNEEAVIKFLEESLLAPYIDNIYVADPMNAATSKIDIINNIGIGKESIYVGDTEADYKCAKELGIKPYILNRGFRSKNFFDSKGIDSVSSLLDVLKCLGIDSGFGRME